MRAAYVEYLSSLSIGSLRSLGRQTGVNKSTVKKKRQLIEEIVAIFCGEAMPTEKNNRGAPVKNDYVDPRILRKLEEIKLYFLSGQSDENKKIDYFPGEKVIQNVLEVQSNECVSIQDAYSQEIYGGQLETINGVSALLPLDGKEGGSEKVIVSRLKISEYDLREGDVVTCRAETCHSALLATKVLSVNGLAVPLTERRRFEEMEAVYPDRRISLVAEKDASTEMKYVEWLAPLGRGQRGIVTAPPKAGKSTLLKSIVQAVPKSNRDMRVLVLLTDASPESVGECGKLLPRSDFIYTTYDDSAEAQIFAADFLLRRAKRFAEIGIDVLLIVDSLTALAHAFDETDAASGGKTLSCGLESNTVHYIKKYLGSARCFKDGGSLTVLGALSVDTGNRADDYLAAELGNAANWEIVLDKTLAETRNFPAIDVVHSSNQRSDLLLTEEEYKTELFVRGKYLSKFGSAATLALVSKCLTSEQLYREATEAVNGK